MLLQPEPLFPFSRRQWESPPTVVVSKQQIRKFRSELGGCKKRRKCCRNLTRSPGSKIVGQFATLPDRRVPRLSCAHTDGLRLCLGVPPRLKLPFMELAVNGIGFDELLPICAIALASSLRLRRAWLAMPESSFQRAAIRVSRLPIPHYA